MFVNWRRQGNYYYAVIVDQRRENGKKRTRSIGYLGRHPVEGLQKLIMEGRITKEEAANLHVGDDPKNLFLKHYVEKLKREVASGKTQENPDKLERIKFILDFHAKQPKRAVRKIREVLENG
ncbi:MAG: hypothetical protein AB1523_15915 [Bacillota bacterium]